MTTKIQLHPVRSITYCIFMMLIMAAFTSCSKKDIKPAATPVENFASNDNATIIMPDATPTTTPAQNNAASRFNTFYGPAVQMGNGHVRSWVNISHDGTPLAIGVEMTDGALSNLPQNPTDFAASTFDISLHQKAKSTTPFDHIVMDWNVHGHEPAGIYDVPHFDFHFYKISMAAQLAIPPYEVNPTGFNVPLPAGYMPPMYMRIPGGVPQMGAHWADVTSPEFHGGGFTSTFIYGTYGGHVTFEEPMITLATLQSGNTTHKNIAQPMHYDPSNTYYPTRYNIWEDPSNSRHYVSLDNLVWR